MSKLERNEMKLFLKTTNVRELIKEITCSFRLIVEQREGTLTEEFKAEKYNFKIDEFHISNALVNLLDNANKYSPEKPEIKIKQETKATGMLLKFLIKEWEWRPKIRVGFLKNSSVKKQEIFTM